MTKDLRKALEVDEGASQLLHSLRDLIQNARQRALRAVDAVQVQTCWEIGRHIVEFEQGGSARAEYGARLLLTLASARIVSILFRLRGRQNVAEILPARKLVLVFCWHQLTITPCRIGEHKPTFRQRRRIYTGYISFSVRKIESVSRK
jgi:hypothetical protein